MNKVEKNRKKKSKSGPPVAQEKVIYCDFKDKAIDKLFIKSGDRVTVKFNNELKAMLIALEKNGEIGIITNADK